MCDFGENLKAMRNSRNLTLKQVASYVGVSDTVICRYEKNEVSPPLNSLIKLAGILNISLDELCGLQPKGTVSLHGLTDEQSEIIKSLTDSLRNHNTAVRKIISPEQYELIGKIVSEFTR